MLKRPQDSCFLVSNKDDAYMEDIVSGRVNKFYSFSDTNTQADCYPESSKIVNGRTEVCFRTPIGELSVSVDSTHLSTPINCAAAICFCLAMGIDKETIISGLNSYQSSPGRYHKFSINSGEESYCIDDSYNASPVSMKSGIQSFISANTSKKIILVLGDMLELGSEEKAAHSDIIDFIPSAAPTADVYFVGPRFLKNSFSGKDNCFFLMWMILSSI